MLKQRVISAIVLIPIVAVLAWLGGWWFSAFVALYAGVTAWELLRMLGELSFVKPVMWLGVPVAVLLVLEGGMPQDPIRLQAFLVVVLLVGMVIALFLNRPNAPTDMLITPQAAWPRLVRSQALPANGDDRVRVKVIASPRKRSR